MSAAQKMQISKSKSLLDVMEGLPFFTNKSKLQRLVKAEQAFLERADCSSAEKVTSNLPYLESVVRMCEAVNACPTLNISAVLKRFTGETGKTVNDSLIMEVVAILPSGGQAWIKCLGQNCSSDRALSMAETSLRLAANNLEATHLCPQICLRFFGATVASEICEQLQQLGVDVAQGPVPPVEAQQPGYDAVNLDTTALIALTTNLSHGEVGWSFNDPVLEQQAAQETEESVLQQLYHFLQGKRLCVSPAALKTYQQLAGRMAGPMELQRFERISSVLSVVEAETPEGFHVSKKVSKATLEIVSVGAVHDMPTCTSNGKAMRSFAEAKKGIKFLQHMPRALSEGKQKTAIKRSGRKHLLPKQQLAHFFDRILGTTAPGDDEQGTGSAATDAGPTSGAETSDEDQQITLGDEEGQNQKVEEEGKEPQDLHMEGALSVDGNDVEDGEGIEDEAGDTGAGQEFEPQGNIDFWTAKRKRRREERAARKRRRKGAVPEQCSEIPAPVSPVAERSECGPTEDFPLFVDFMPFFTNLVADSHYRDLCQSCLVALQKVCEGALTQEEFQMKPFDWFPEPKLLAFGSYIQGTALKSSDLDVRLSLQFDVKQVDRQLKYLNGIANWKAENFETDVLISTALIPLLRLRYCGELQVDITMGDADDCGAVDDAISRILAVESNARSLVCLVKAFAKSKGLIDAYGGFLNSVGWVFLCISFLQVERALPGLDALQENEELRPVQVDMTTLYRLFEYVASCCTKQCRISLLRSKGFGPLPHKGSALFLEHPTLPDRNLARSFRQPQTTVQACRDAQNQLLRSQELLRDMFADPGGSTARAKRKMSKNES